MSNSRGTALPCTTLDWQTPRYNKLNYILVLLSWETHGCVTQDYDSRKKKTDNSTQRGTYSLLWLDRYMTNWTFFTVNTNLVILRPFYTECPPLLIPWENRKPTFFINRILLFFFFFFFFSFTNFEKSHCQ